MLTIRIRVEEEEDKITAFVVDEEQHILYTRTHQMPGNILKASLAVLLDLNAWLGMYLCNKDLLGL